MIIITLVILGSVMVVGYTFINGIEEGSTLLSNTPVIGGYSVGGALDSSNTTNDENESNDNDTGGESGESTDVIPLEQYAGEIRIKNCLIYSPSSSELTNFQATDEYGVIYYIENGELISNDGTSFYSSVQKTGILYRIYNIREISLDPLYNKNYQIAIDNKKLSDYQERSFKATTYDGDGTLNIHVYNDGDIILYTLPHNYVGVLEFQE